MPSSVWEARGCEMRVEAGTSGPPVLAGVAVRYGERAKIAGFTEAFQAGAFGEIGDVIANVQHSRERPLARTGAGLTLTDSAERLEVRLALPETRDGEDVATLVKLGVLRGLSVEFRAANERWEGSHRVIERAVLNGVAVVDRPAYSGSVIVEGRWESDTARIGEYLGWIKRPKKGARRWLSM